jgi:hypothetical protein
MRTGVGAKISAVVGGSLLFTLGAIAALLMQVNASDRAYDTILAGIVQKQEKALAVSQPGSSATSSSPPYRARTS